jgi:hypothetical protein
MADERERERDEEGEAGAPFDEDPPVDPMSQQVGNSNARFFVPRDEEAQDAADHDKNGTGEEEGAQESGS